MQYSAVWRRGAAAIIDATLLSILSSFLMRTYFLFPLAFALHFFYRPIFESSRVRGTPGKYLAEIAVVKTNGDQLDLKTAYIRYFASWLSAMCFMLGYFFAFFNSKKQTLHDIIAETVVIDQVYENHGLWQEWVTQMKLFGEWSRDLWEKYRPNK